MKFVLDRTISSNSLSFFNSDQAKNHPLVAKLFEISGVTNVMLLSDFVTIGKLPQARWSDINTQVEQVLAAV